MKTDIRTIINNFADLNILVIGESALDSYITGSARRLCPDAPVPVIDVEKEEYKGGAAANTAINLAALGANVQFLTAVGKDTEGEILQNILTQQNIATNFIFTDSTRKTLTKKRVTTDGQLVVRIDAG